MAVSLAAVLCLVFLVEYFLILGTDRMSGCASQPVRSAAAAALATVYAAVCLMPNCRFLGGLFWRMISLALLGMVAFGCKRNGILRWGILGMLHLALEGAALLAARETFAGLMPSLIPVWLLGMAALMRPAEEGLYVPLELQRDGKTIRLLALRDTGNTLRDPVTGKPVLVISPEAAGQLTGLTEKQLRDPLKTMMGHPLPGLRLVPCRTVAGSGLLLGMVFDVKLGSKGRTALVAFAPESFGSGTAVQALTGGDL